MAGKQKTYFTGISPKTWEHPADRAALSALKAVPALNDVIKFFVGVTSEKSLHYLFLASSVRVSEKQFPKVHLLLEEACAVLDAPQVPEIFVSQDPSLNARAIGVDKSFIVLNSSLLDTLDEEELLCVIGHELSHIISGHVLYKTLLWFLLNLGTNVLGIPIGKLAFSGVLAALKEWDRKSELSADRAGLLTVQNREPAYTVLMKMAGGAHTGDMNLDEFFVQAAEYDSAGNLLDGVHKLLNLIGEQHPFPVVRLSELKTWHDAGGLEQTLEGNYRRRDEEEKEDIQREFRAAADQYREDMSKSKDPLAQFAKNIGDGLENIRRDAEGFIKSIFP